MFIFILFAIMQGVSELFPISSLGHGVVWPQLLHWDIDQRAPFFLPFMVSLHLATALALFWYFRHDWFTLLKGLTEHRAINERKLLLQLVVGTIPAGVIGLIFEKALSELFSTGRVVCVVFILNGLLLLLGDYLHKRLSTRSRPLEALSYLDACKIGLAQCLALIPGFSRSGITLIAGLKQGLSYAAAARFSFLLATPIIAAAALLEIPKLFSAGHTLAFDLILLCGLISGGIAYLSTAFLMRYFKKKETQALQPFGWYCLGLGIIGLLLLPQ